MFQIQDQSQRPLTTAHLAQTMSLLLLSNQELKDKVISELAENPALELVEEPKCPHCKKRLPKPGPCPVCSRNLEGDEPIVFLSPRVSQNQRRRNRHHEDFEPMDREIAAPESLAMFVLEQLAAELQPEDRKLALYILASLDDDGFLQDPPAIIARMTRSPISQVDRVVHLISRVDPPGLATSGPRQALLVQLDLLTNGGQKREIAKHMLDEYFSELGRRDFETIASNLDISVNRVRQTAGFIHDNLNPYPARSSWGSNRQSQTRDPNVYHAPDIAITHNPSGENEALIVEIFAPVSGWLRVNPLFKKYKEQQNGDISDEWKEHIDRANLFVKCLLYLLSKFRKYNIDNINDCISSLKARCLVMKSEDVGIYKPRSHRPK